jgi:hypothetical protein
MYNKKLIATTLSVSYIILLGIILSQYIYIRKLESDTEVDDNSVLSAFK